MEKRMYEVKATATIRKPFGDPDIKELPVFHIDPELHGISDKKELEAVVSNIFRGLTGFGTTVVYAVKEVIFGQEVTA